MKKIASIVIVSALLLSIGAISVFADTSLYKDYLFLEDRVGIYVNQHLTDPVLVNVSEYTINSGQQSHRYFTIKQDLDVVIKITNRTTDTKFNMSRINLAVPLVSPSGSTGFTSIGYSQSAYTFDADNGIEVLYRGQLSHSSGAPTFLIHSGEDRFIFLGENQSITIHVTTTLYHTYFSTSNSITTSTVMKNLGYTMPSSLSDSNLTVTSIGVTTTTNVYNDSYNIHQIERKLQAILDNYNVNSPTADTLVEDTSRTSEIIDTVHESEMEFYEQNRSAMSEVGLSNFEYDPDVRLGYNSILTDFNKLWNALGKWNFIYTFTLLLSLTTFILRHKPWTTNRTFKDS